LTFLLVSVVFLVPTYAGKKPKQVEVVNDAGNPIPVVGEMTLTDGAARKTIRSGYAETGGQSIILTVSAGKTFILTDIVSYLCPNCDGGVRFSIKEDETVKLKLTVGFQSVHLNSGVPFAAGSDVVLSSESSNVAILICGYEIED